MACTFDERLTFTGYCGCTSTTRIRVYAREDLAPVVIVTELSDNPGTSVNTGAELLAAIVILEVLYLDERVASHLRLAPFVWVEHYPANPRTHREEEFDWVTFASYQVRPVLRSGLTHREVGAAEWTYADRAEVEAAIGEALPDLTLAEMLAEQSRAAVAVAEVEVQAHA